MMFKLKKYILEIMWHISYGYIDIITHNNLLIIKKSNCKKWHMMILHQLLEIVQKEKHKDSTFMI